MLLDVRLGSLVSVAFQIIKIMQLLLSQCLVRDFEDAVPLISELRGGTIARRRAVREDMYICTSDPGVQYCTLGVARRVQQLHL